MNRVKNKTAIVTGGARGLGAAFVRTLVAEGAKVVIADILTEDGNALCAQLGEATRFETLDVRHESEWQRVVCVTEAAFGPVSILVNNAGILLTSPLESHLEVDYRSVIDVNQVGVFLGMKTIVSSMRRAGGGSIINLSSFSGLRATPNSMAYTASKFAVRGMSKVAALELASDGIRVNSIHPGPFNTAMTAGGDKESVLAAAAGLPASRFGEPEELAHMVLLLASDEMRFATGAEFVVDGGMSCR